MYLDLMCLNDLFLEVIKFSCSLWVSSEFCNDHFDTIGSIIKESRKNLNVFIIYGFSMMQF